MSGEIEIRSTEIIEFDEFKTKMLEFRKRYDDIVYDLDDKSQEKQAKSDRFAIGQVISSLDKRHKEIKAPLAEKVSLIDGERKRIKDELLAIQNKIKSQIEDHAKKIAEHEAMLQDKVNIILHFNNVNESSHVNSDCLKELLNALQSIVIDNSFEHRQNEALQAQDRAICRLSALYNEKVKFENQEEELEIFRKEKEERRRSDAKRIFEDAQKELAKVFAEERYKDAVLAVEQGKERERKHAEELERAKQEAVEEAISKEHDRLEREQQEAKEKIDAENKALEIEKSRTDHRNNIEEEAASSLEPLLVDKYFGHLLTYGDISVSIINMIKVGKVKHLKLIY